MKKVLLVFPTLNIMGSYISDNYLLNTITDDKKRSLTMRLPDELIVLACTTYMAYIEITIEP